MIYQKKIYLPQEEFVVVNDLDEDLKPIRFKCPDIPNDNKILNYNLPKHQQKFYRTQIPERLVALMKRIRRECDEFNFRTKQKNKQTRRIFNDEMHRELRVNADKYEDIWKFILEEWRRRREGVWFFNNGVRTYITGMMYFWMNYWTLEEGGVPDYIDRDRRLFHFIEEGKKDEHCVGIIEMGGRKYGKSARAACAIFDNLTQMEGKQCGIQSKNDKDAEVLFDKIIIGWKGIPFYFQPLHNYYNTQPAKVLKFSIEDGETQDRKDLGSWLDYRAVKASAYDSTKLGWYIDDECGKLETVDAYKRWITVKPAMYDHFKRKAGFSHHTTTVEDAGMYGFEQFQKLWDGSDYHKRDELGRTETGLWRIFFPAYDGMKVDQFGMSMLREGKHELDIERKSIKVGTDSYYENIRKYPYTTRECFSINAGKCPFDKDTLYKRLSYFFKGNPYMRRGDLVWKNGQKDTVVEFVENPQGRFNFTHMPPENLRNGVEIKGKMRSPKNDLFYIAGGDTFNFDKTEGKGSNGGGAVFMRHNPVMERPLDDIQEWWSEEQKNDYYYRYKSNRFTCTYNYRPPSKEEFIDDMIKMCVFFGCSMFPEMNHPHIEDGFKRRGYGGFLLHKFDEKKQKLKQSAGDVTNDITKDNLFMVTQDHIIENCDYEFHDDFLKECLGVSYEAMTEFDLFSACAYALYGNSLTMHLIEKEKERKKKIEAMIKERRKLHYSEHDTL